MPAKSEQDWLRLRSKISASMSGHLKRFHRLNPRRIGLRQFSDCEAGLVRFNVYWDQETYNQLHAVAHAVCMSVSHLLWQILMFVLSGGDVQAEVSNYDFRVRKWSSRRLEFSEKLIFRSEKWKKHNNSDPKYWDKTPLRFTA